MPPRSWSPRKVRSVIGFATCPAAISDAATSKMRRWISSAKSSAFTSGATTSSVALFSRMEPSSEASISLLCGGTRTASAPGGGT